MVLLDCGGAGYVAAGCDAAGWGASFYVVASSDAAGCGSTGRGVGVSVGVACGAADLAVAGCGVDQHPSINKI